MILTRPKRSLLSLLHKQIGNNFGCSAKEKAILEQAVNTALPVTERCFSAINNKYFRNADGTAIFDPLHSGQYTIFLFYLSRTVWQDARNAELASKVYYLNKMLNGCDLYYEVNLPGIFWLDHPVGSVMGRATYSDYFVFQQNCTVGGNKGKYPRIGKYVWLHASSMIIGDSAIGDNVLVSAGTIIKDTVIPSNSIVFGISPRLVIKQVPAERIHANSPFILDQKTLPPKAK